MRRYYQVWSTDGVRGLLLANLLSAAGIGAMPVAVLLGLQARFGGLGAAGSAVGLFGVGNALGLIIQGRLLDRVGQRRVLVVAAVGCVGTLLAVLIMINDRASRPSAIAVAAGFLCAGILLPGLTAAVRSRLAGHPGLVEARLAAYSMLSVTFQAGMAVGPLVVSAVLLVLGPTMVLVVPIVELATAMVCFLIAGGASEPGRPRPRELPVHTGPGGSATGLAVLAGAALATGAASGMTAVGIPAVALAVGRAGLSGIAFAMIAVGDLVGGVLYGSRGTNRALGRQLVAAQLAAITCAVAVVAVGAWPVILVVVLFAGALVAAPAGIVTSALLDQVSRPDRIAAGYTMIVSSGLIGSAIASSVAGRLADQFGPRVPFMVAPPCLAAALIMVGGWLLARRAPT